MSRAHARALETEAAGASTDELRAVLADVLARSSNVGAARIALDLPREAMWDLYRRVGFGAAPELGFPGAATGRLRHYKTWRPVEQAT